MAIQVSGTEVISNARNISNVGTVTATSFVGDGAGLTGLSSAPFANTLNKDRISSRRMICVSKLFNSVQH